MANVGYFLIKIILTSWWDIFLNGVYAIFDIERKILTEKKAYLRDRLLFFLLIFDKLELIVIYEHIW